MSQHLLFKAGRHICHFYLALCAAIFFLAQSHLAAQTPELLYYRFDGSGTSVPNQASSPPSGTATATIIGDQTIGSTGQCNEALIGTGSNSTNNYVNTGWVPDLGGSSWTISLWINNVPNYSQLWYIFGEVNTGGFRCFTNGVTGADNYWLRGGGLNDVPVNGGAAAGPQVITFVYDNTLNNVKAYLNGVLVNTVAQGTVNAVNITGTGPFKVAGYSSNFGLAPSSRMDEFRLYNRALSATEVAAIAGNICYCYIDADGDGYGDASDPGVESQQAVCPMGTVGNNKDCDDTNPNINPEGTEVCDNLDNDCSGMADDGNDMDGDGYSVAQGDCDDCNADLNPGELELCGNNIDDNCDGLVDVGFSSPGGVIFSEDFDNIPGPTDGGLGTFTFPAGWLLANVDNRAPASSVSYVNQAWERREDFISNVADTCAFSTSWTNPTGVADDWMWTPLIGPITAGSELKWKAVAPDPSFPDGYEVRVMTASAGPPNGSDGTIGNMVSNSNVVFSIGAENASWTDREVDISSYAGQSVYIAFRNNSNNKFLLLIDDIEVNASSVMVEPEPINFYADNDGDGYGNPNAPQVSCTPPQGYVLNNTDCNDNDADINPGEAEICDGKDNDCDGLTDTNDPDFVDNTPPTVSCTGQVTLVFNGENSIQIDGVNSPVNLQIQAGDNCGVQSITISPATIYANQVGQTVPVIITVTDFKGATATCNSSIVVSGLPEGWSAQPNGVGCSNGNSAQYNTGTGVWTATSTNCFYGPPFTSDATSFAQRTLCGDGSITARVTSINGSGWAGVVMRESNAPGTKKAQLMTNLSQFHRREFRTTTNAAAQPQQIGSNNRHWLRITRAGNQFTLSASANGISWFPVGAQNIAMGNCIQIGLVASNSTANSTVTATFAHVSFSGSNGGLGTGSIVQREESIEAPHSFEVYPNPTSGDLNVTLTQYVGRSVRLELYSIEGKLLQFSEIDEVQTTVENLNLSEYSNGMYFLKVKSRELPDVTKRVVLTKK